MKYQRTLVIILTLTFVFFSILSPSRFLRPYNLQTMLFQLPEFGILSLGMMICIATGGINLSISAATALSGIIGALILSGHVDSSLSVGWMIFGAIALGLITSFLTGVLNGVFVAFLGVTPILVTVGTRAVFEGIGFVLTKGGSVSGFPEGFDFIGAAAPLGIPFPLFIFSLVAAGTYLLLHRTPWGSRVFMIGSSPNASKYSGIPVRRILMQVYVYSSLMAGVAAVVMISRYNSGKVTLGSSYLLQSIAAVVLGGTSIYGGRGSVLGVILATAILQVISSGMNILGINRFLIQVSTGAILILALTVNYFAENGKLPKIGRFFGKSSTGEKQPTAEM